MQRQLFVATTLSVITMDLASKAWASQALADRPIDLPGPLDLRLGYNRGIAFSLLTDVPAVVIVTLTGLVAVGLIVAALRGSVPLLPTGLVVGGAIANIIDRLHNGSVVDMLHTSFWPTFNVADVAITCGAAMWLIGSIQRPTHTTTKSADETTTPA